MPVQETSPQTQKVHALSSASKSLWNCATCKRRRCHRKIGTTTEIRLKMSERKDRKTATNKDDVKTSLENEKWGKQGHMKLNEIEPPPQKKAYFRSRQLSSHALLGTGSGAGVAPERRVRPTAALECYSGISHQIHFPQPDFWYRLGSPGGAGVDKTDMLLSSRTQVVLSPWQDASARPQRRLVTSVQFSSQEAVIFAKGQS